MPDYIYLLENRLSPDQQNALRIVREAARNAGMTVFLAGGAVRDLTSGSPVRDLDVTVQGNALKLKKTIEKAGGTFWGEHEPSKTLFFAFAPMVRVEISSARREDYPKPGKPVYHPASILEDLRRRDFTANAMALSLNEGSYGLLMDPLNGVADIEARTLRLVSNYGFLEEPSRLIRAARLQARLGWQMDEKTRTRYDNAREEGVIEALSPYLRGYELEEIAHEEDALKALSALEADGWMQHLFPAWTSAKADSQGLANLHQVLTQILMQGVNPDPSTAQLQLLTGKLAAKDIQSLKATFVRPGFVAEWDRLDEDAKEFAKLLTSKQATEPSATWQLFTSHNPQAVLWLGFTSKSAPVQAKYKSFYGEWPEARTRIPYALMQEMRITPELPGYQDLLRSLFFGIIDGKLQTEEQFRAFLEPHSPPAPPPPVSIRRSRTKKSAAQKIREEEEEEEDLPSVVDLDSDSDDTGDEAEEDEEPEAPLPPRPVKTAPPARTTPKATAVPPPAKAPAKAAGKAVPAEKKAPEKGEPAPVAVKKPASVPAKSVGAAVKAPAKTSAAKPSVKLPVKAAAPAKKPAAKAAVKVVARKSAKRVQKKASVPVKKTSAKPAAKKAVKAPAKPAAKTKAAAKKAPGKKKH